MPVDWLSIEVDWPRHVEAAVSAFCQGHICVWLDSAAPDADSSIATPGNYSMICLDPVGTIEQCKRGPARFFTERGEVAKDDNGWTLWKTIHRRLPTLHRSDFSLAPGWAGYVGFEMARFLERLPQTAPYDLDLPLLRMMLFDRGIVLDHRRRRAYALMAPDLLSVLDMPESSIEESIEDWRRAAQATEYHADQPSPRILHDLPRDEYRRMIRRALEYIAAGDIYQVNLAQRIRCLGAGDTFAAYCRMRRANPAAYAAFMRWPGGALGSVSPELFFRLRDREALTSPIKGTRPHTGDPVLDAAYERELLASEKDAAELAMIIDLHRNDLGKVCEYGSVRVCEARRIEAHPTVFHTVADIAGRLRTEFDGLDLLEACFPAGSISGVPKIRALEIIDELEPAARGAYTGTAGVLSLDGQATFNVAIRTVQFQQDAALVYVGGGIVADSDPKEEYEETLAKARGMLRGLLGEDPAGRVCDQATRAANHE